MSGYWYKTTHGVQPGSVPRNNYVLDIVDTPSGSYVCLENVVPISDLIRYDLKEEAPEGVEAASSTKRCFTVKSATNTANGFGADMSNCFSSDFGGAFDIEPDMFFTREEIDEFAYEVADELSAEYVDCTIDVADCYMTTSTHLCCEFNVIIEDTEFDCTAEVDIDLETIDKPSDLMFYKEIIKDEVRKDIQEYIGEM